MDEGKSLLIDWGKRRNINDDVYISKVRGLDEQGCNTP